MATTENDFNHGEYSDMPPQGLGAPGMMPLLPVAPSNDPNQNYFMNINQGIGNGFGPMFFNLRDPTTTKTNDPIKQPTSWHVPIIVVSVIFLGCLITGIVGHSVGFLDVGGMVPMIIISYVIYLVIAICCSDMKEYLQNMKRFVDFQDTYDKMIKGRGYFHFFIECYHYETRTRTVHRNGKSHTETYQEKVVTHTARRDFHPLESIDESGTLTSITDVRDYVFLDYLKRYYFTDDISQQTYINEFNNFVRANTRDQYQNYSHTFEIEGYEPNVAFTATGEGTKPTVAFYIFTFLGLGIIFACILERSVARYDVGILKRITVR